MAAPVYPNAALGYRVWYLINGMLRPLYQSDKTVWTAGENKAYCNVHHHPAPAAGCLCGFNAYHDLGSALVDAKIFMGSPRARMLNVGSLVIGVIAGRGHIEIHKDGFRCETAQILALAPISFGPYPLHSGRELLENLASIYHSIPIYDRAHQLEEIEAGISGPYRTGKANVIPETIRPRRNWGLCNYGLLLRFAPLSMFVLCLGAWCLFPDWRSICWGGVIGCVWGMFYSLRTDLQRDAAFPADWKRLFKH